MADFDKGADKLPEHVPVPTQRPIELHPQSADAKTKAAEQLAASGEQMVKANVLPAMPDFPKAESLYNAPGNKVLDANQKVVSETSTLANSPTGAHDLKQVIQYDTASGNPTSISTDWTDAKGSKHNVVQKGDGTTNTITTGNKVDKLVTHIDGTWEHDVSNGATSTTTRIDKDKSVSVTEKNLQTGDSQTHVTHQNGFTEDITTRKGFKESQTKDSNGVLRFDAIIDAKTDDGKLNYRLTKRLDSKGNVLSDDSHWNDSKGVYHEDDTMNFADRTKIHSVTVGDKTQTTTTKLDGKSDTVTVMADGTTIDSNGVVRKPDALDKPTQPGK